MLIVMNAYLLVTFWSLLSGSLTHLSRGLKPKLVVLFTTTILTLISRTLLTVYVLASLGTLVLPLVITCCICVSEILPVIMLIISFLLLNAPAIGATDSQALKESMLGGFIVNGTAESSGEPTYEEKNNHKTTDQADSEQFEPEIEEGKEMQSELKIALKNMMSDIGVDNPSFESYSALSNNSEIYYESVSIENKTDESAYHKESQSSQ